MISSRDAHFPDYRATASKECETDWSALRFRSQYFLIPFDQEGTGESESEGNGESGEQE